MSNCSKKIYLKVNGGLGNQMFQWAFARSLMEKGFDVILDLTFFNKSYSKNRPYKLGIFNFEPKKSEDFLTNFMLEFFWKFRKYEFSKSLTGLKYYSEPTFEFDKNAFCLEDNTFVDGFFQTEKYFKDVKDKVKEDFIFKVPLSDENNKIITKMRGENSVSVHIRRGDYVTKSRYNKTYAHCTVKYYENAVDYIAKKFPNPHIYIFSDDTDWIKENIKFPYETEYVTHNIGQNSFEDIRLMSNCKHNVIANSTFSWWGAWLNQNSEKLVVCPDVWFQDSRIVQTDIYPKEWIRIKND